MSIAVRRGFALVALLAVLALIAMPAAIRFSVSARAGGRARQAGCLSNSKPMRQAAMMYVEDYDEVLSAACIWYPVPVSQAVYRGTDSSVT